MSLNILPHFSFLASFSRINVQKTLICNWKNNFFKFWGSIQILFFFMEWLIHILMRFTNRAPGVIIFIILSKKYKNFVKLITTRGYNEIIYLVVIITRYIMKLYTWWYNITRYIMKLLPLVVINFMFYANFNFFQDFSH